MEIHLAVLFVTIFLTLTLQGHLLEGNELNKCLHSYSDSGRSNCSCDNFHSTCKCHTSVEGCPATDGIIPQCVETSKICDGYNFCGDWSDERNCTCASDMFACDCHKTVEGCKVDFEVFMSHCYNQTQKCNGILDCIDGSDERNCSCHAGTLPCNCQLTEAGCSVLDFQCYSPSMKCDAKLNCEDGTDENNCTYAYTCDCNHSVDGCSDQSLGFYTELQKCNGHDDCGDQSDEKNCKCKANELHCPCNNTSNSSVDGCIVRNNAVLRCYTAKQKCDHQNDCGDWGDEINCPKTCQENEFLCDSPCQGNHCPPEYLKIPNCYDKTKRCDQNNDCGDWSDESNCMCSSNQVKCGCVDVIGNCTSKYGCIDPAKVLDGKTDCFDKSDEACELVTVFTQTHNDHTTLCRNASEYEKFKHLSFRYHFKPHICIQTYIYHANNSNQLVWWCDSSHISNTTWMFTQCDNGDLIEEKNLCSGKQVCPDGSGNKYNVPGFKCKAKIQYVQNNVECVLPQINLYDSTSYCADGSDECFINGKLKCFECLDGKLLLAPNQVCDGTIDCYDLSDECLCENQKTCIETLTTSRQLCKFDEMLCNGNCVSTSKTLCNANIVCANNTNMRYCSQNQLTKGFEQITCKLSDNSIGSAIKCDGIPECWNREDECVDCPLKSHFCDVNILCHQDLLRNKLAYCDGKEKLQGFGDLSNICRHGFDEVNCTTQFYCKNGHFISIPRADMCDGEINCDDGSDEAKSLCQFTRFYCRNGKPLSVPVNTVENGIKDCFDGSDECPINSNKSSIFSSPREMIANQFFRILFWFMGIIAIVGNSIVFTGSVIKLIKGNNPVALVNHLFIINISFSDFLMGVYLIAISIKGLTFSGSYCYHDLEWRSSSLCSFLGALVVTSIEASAVTMTLMTTFRLLSVWDPIRMQHVSWKPFCFSLVIVWVIAIFLGTIPLFAETEYFLSSIWFPNYFYSRQIMRKADVIQLIQRIGENTNTTFGTLDWQHMQDLLKANFKSLSVIGEFGYYSETSVCMPRLFVKVGDAAWEFSTIVTTLNFSMFLYMVISYAIIYKLGTKMKDSRNEAKNKNLQRKISRLIATDFSCWMPLCILAYINLSGLKLNAIVYVVSAGLLLPINSTLNPLLYSQVLENIITTLFNKFKSKCGNSERKKLGSRLDSKVNTITTSTGNN